MRVQGGCGLHGRERELAAISRLAGSLASHAGGALVVRGEPGAGKSALLAEAAAAAARLRLRVLPAACARQEAGIPFAGLHRLLHPLLPRADGLPPRQRRALFAASGLADEGLDPLAAGLAALGLISGDQTQPTLGIIDDAQWLDDASSTVLGLAARRLSGRAGALLVAICDGHRSRFDATGLAELRLRQLTDTQARALLGSRVTSPAARERLLAAAAGNPLALTELPATWPDSDSEKSQLVLPLTERLRHALAAPASDLPAATRSLLTIAAADCAAGTGLPPADDAVTLSELLAAASIGPASDLTLEAISPAISAGLVEVRQHALAFTHPLLPTAIYQAATAARRHAAHAALAQALAGRPDRQAWHQAAAALGPDSEIAARLDQTATRAERRGADRLATTALERAAELSAAQADRGGRLLRAAEIALDGGDLSHGLRLMRSAAPLDLAADQQAWRSWLRQTYASAGSPIADSPIADSSIVGRSIADGRGLLAAGSLRAAAVRCWWGSPDQPARTAISAAAERIPLPPDEPVKLALLACADPVRNGALACDLIAGKAVDPADPAGMYLIGLAALAAGACRSSLAFLDPAIAGFRAQGRHGALAQALACQAWAAVQLARGNLAASTAQEAVHLARQTGQPWLAAAALLAKAAILAQRGDSAEADSLISDAETGLAPEGTSTTLALAQFVRGRGAVTCQLYGQAAAHLRRALDPADPACHHVIGAWGLADLVEATIRTGQRDAAAAHLRDLESLARLTTAPLYRAQAAYARPMLAGEDQAEALVRTALDRDLAGWPCLRARTLLWYGRWLRRERRIAESRAPLRAARDSFEALEFGPLAECARRELRASGERGQHSGSADQLTAQELQIARLAADGLSNREIGQQLCISHRTVGYHLHRVFPKLGITSRSQLHAAVTS